MTGVVEGYLRDQGYRLAGKGRPKMLSAWEQWYRGYVPEAHRYAVQCGKTRKTAQRYRLGMAKVICQDFGTLLINEHVKVVCEDLPEALDVLEANHFHTRMNRLAELTMALGTGAVTVYRGADGAPELCYIPATMIYPLRWDNETVTECAFASERIIGEGKDAQTGYYVQMHVRKGEGWVIRNALLTANGRPWPLPEGIDEESPVSPIPLFSLVRPNSVNTEEPNSPMGASVFADAIDQLMGCDLIYDSYINEFVLGKKRMLVPLSLATVIAQENGTVEPIFDPNDMLFYTYGQMGDAGDSGKPIEVDMHLRTAEHEQGLQRQLNLLSKKCGLGTDRYRFDAGQAETATEVISTKSDLYQSLKRHEKTFGDAIVNIVRGIAFVLGRDVNVEVSVEFDDSIIEDTNATITRVRNLVGSGLMSKRDAIMEIEKCDEETADEVLRQIAKETEITQKAVEDYFGRGEEE